MTRPIFFSLYTSILCSLVSILKNSTMPRNKGSDTSSVNGKIIPVVGLGDPDYADQLVVSTLSNGSTVFTSGLALDILLLLEKTLNFSHTAIRGEGWPDRLENGSWTGISRQVMDHEADLSIAQTAFVGGRLREFDFLIPTTLGYLTASFKQPSSNSLKNLLTASFGLDLWIALLLSACLILASIKIMRWVRLKYADPNWDDPDGDGLHGDLLHSEEAAYWVLVTFCQRTFVGSPKSTPMRSIYISLTITSLVAYTALSATLISTMSIETSTIKTFADLIKTNLDVYGDIAAIPITQRFVQSMVDSKRKFEGLGVRRKNISAARFLDVHTGLRKTLTEPATYVTFDGVPFLTYRKMGLSDEFMCSKKLSSFRVPGSKMTAGLFVRKGSYLRGIFNPKIVSFHQHGFIKRLRTKWSTDATPKCGRTTVRFHWNDPMDLKDVHTPITVLISGFVLSIVILALEFNYRWLFVECKFFNISRTYDNLLETFKRERRR